MRFSVAWKRAAGGAAACTCLLAGAPAAAQDPQTLHDALFGVFRRDDRGVSSLPPVARYQGQAGQRFVLDRSSGGALLRFEDNPEIWVLKPTPGPRGDVIYRNDVGEPVLRSMRVGGLTLFTSDKPTGVAAALAGPASGIRPLNITTPTQLLQVLVTASTRASRAAQKLIPFEAPDYTPGTEPIWADAAILTAEAFVRVAGAGRNGREVIARFVRVRFYPGRPAAAIAGKEVRIYVSPKDGVAGRPSSKRIATVIAAR